VRESFVVVKKLEDPYKDLKRSVIDMKHNNRILQNIRSARYQVHVGNNMALCLVSFIYLFYFIEQFFGFIYGFVSKEKRRTKVMGKMKKVTLAYHISIQRNDKS